MFYEKKMVMRKTGLTIMLSLLTVTALSSFGKAEEAGEQAKLGIDLDSTFVTRYMWRGYDLYDDHAAWQPSISYDLFGTGFSTCVWLSHPFDGGLNDDWQELNYIIAYDRTFFEDQHYAIDFMFNYVYYDFFKQPTEARDFQELGASVSLPNLIKIGESSLIPSYYFCKDWPTKSHNPGIAGWFHILGLSYDLPIPCPFREDTSQVFSFTTELVYNDGTFGSDHDWSNVVFGVSTSIELGPVTLTPSLNYQITMDDSVNLDKDVLWGV